MFGAGLLEQGRNALRSRIGAANSRASDETYDVDDRGNQEQRQNHRGDPATSKQEVQRVTTEVYAQLQRGQTRPKIPAWASAPEVTRRAFGRRRTHL